jgi:hypothetical protein
MPQCRGRLTFIPSGAPGIVASVVQVRGYMAISGRPFCAHRVWNAPG